MATMAIARVKYAQNSTQNAVIVYTHYVFLV